jgi:lipopolysaccharide/colanic/teichoic acid biosynthesis glycosyltransferase
MIHKLCIRFLDFVISLFLLICLLPVLFSVSVLISLYIDFPPFHCSKRIGKNRKPFTHLKLKTMLPGEETGRVFFEQHRLTPLGKLLRRYHIDEIPELLLVLFGKMSLVGPRPLPSQHLTEYNTHLRHAIKPGYTGTAQIYLLKKGFLPKEIQNRLDCKLVNNLTVKRYCLIILATLYYNTKPATINMDPQLSMARRKYHNR